MEIEIEKRRSTRSKQPSRSLYTPAPVIKKSPKKKEKKISLISNPKSMIQLPSKKDPFRLEPYLDSSCPTFTFSVPHIIQTEEDGEMIHSHYPVVLEWNPPHRIQWSCPCGQPYGIEKRHGCKHIQYVMHHLTNPHDVEKKVEQDTHEMNSLMECFQKM